MTYVFLTFTMQFAGGGPLYVLTKMKWLRSMGINVVVFDHYGALHINKDIDLDEFREFEKNRMLELFFPPSYFTIKQRERVIDRMKRHIGNDSDYAVESNSLRLALWGELLAKKLHAKHIILDINEHPDIRNEKEFEYLNFKLNRGELYSIMPQAIKLMFKGYIEFEDEEAMQYKFSADMEVKLSDSPMPILDTLPKADYNILSFGRYKPYFDNMVKGVADFALSHREKRINFIFMGEVTEKDISPEILQAVTNIKYVIIPSMRFVPKAIFDYCDVVIATSGCAAMAAKCEAKTIAMNVENGKPLGVLCYTTMNCVLNNDGIIDNRSVSELLEDIIVNRRYDNQIRKQFAKPYHWFDFQLGLINDDRTYWNEVPNIVHDKSFMKIIVEKIILRLGLIKMFAK